MFLVLQKERETYEVIVEDGKLVYKQSGMLLDTNERSKWIFVLSTSRSLYVGQKKKGVFQHSSFLSGGATTAAGRLVAHDGILEVCILRYTKDIHTRSIRLPLNLMFLIFFRQYGHTVVTIFQQKTILRNL